MKTTFKSIITIIMIIAMIIITTSCGNMFGNDEVVIVNPSDTFVSASNYLGDVSRIIPNTTTCRSTHRSAMDYTFEAFLVEYNSVKPELLDYVEQFENNVCLMNSHEGVTFSDEKKYVEYTIIYKLDGSISRHRISIFEGNWLDLFELGVPCAKGCEFNAEFTYDFSHMNNVDFGEPFVSE